MTHSYVWYDSFTCVTWLIHIHDVTHSYVWHELIHMCDMNSFICLTWTHSYVWHDSFKCVTWLNHMFDMPHSYVWHELIYMCDMNSFICVTWTHSYVWHASSYAVGHFAKEPYKSDYILQKRPMILRSLHMCDMPRHTLSHVWMSHVYICIIQYMNTSIYNTKYAHGVATISRLLKMIGLFCRL